MINYKCEFCGKEFQDTKRRKYCSVPCNKKAYVARLPEKKCKQCGKEFKPGRRESIYCSRRCLGDSKKCPKVTCPICSIEFEPERLSQKYCSRNCFSKVESPNKGKYLTLKPKKCKWCRKEFHPKNYKTIFCSIGCKKSEGQSRRTNSCLICGKDYKRHYVDQLYCSNKCFGIGSAGEKNPFYKNGKHLDKSNGYTSVSGHGKKTYEHREIFFRESKQTDCAICGGDIEVIHHIDDDRGNNNINNLLGLCSSCHPKLHAALRREHQGKEIEPKYAKILFLYYQFIRCRCEDNIILQV